MPADDEINRRAMLHRTMIRASAAVTGVALANGFLTQHATRAKKGAGLPAAATALPEGTLMLIGGGIPTVSHEKLQSGETLSKEELDRAGMFEKMLSLFQRKVPRAWPKVVCITTACPGNTEKKNSVKEGEQLKMIFERLGVPSDNIKIIDTQERDDIVRDPKIKRMLEWADVIYINGGDQEILSKVFHNTEAMQIIQRRYQCDNVVIAGNSAGAAIMSDYMTANNNPAYLKDGTRGLPPERGHGLGLLPKVIVEQHLINHKGREHRLLAALDEDIKNGKDHIGIGVDPFTAAIIRKGALEHFGEGRVVVAVDKNNKLMLDAAPADLREFNGCTRFLKSDLSICCFEGERSIELGRYATGPLPPKKEAARTP